MLLEALSISPGECVAAVGAGGKTALCWRLAQELAWRSHRVVFTTTTRIRRPAPGAFDRVDVEQNLGAVSQSLAENSSAWLTACVAAAIDGEPDETPMPDSTMPVVHTKLSGFAADEVCRLQRSISNPQSPISFLVEADGARGRWIKAPADYEPVIPPCADVVCVVANLDAIGRPLDGRVAHRAERIASLTGASLGSAITPELIVDLLSHPGGGFRGIPVGARRLAVLTQSDADELHPDSMAVARGVIERGYAVAVGAALMKNGALRPFVACC